MKYDPAMSWLGADASPASSMAIQSDLAAIASAPPFLAPKGTWFDEAVDFREPEGDAFTKAVLKLLAIVETRDRKRRKTDEINHYTIVRKILANGFRCHHHRAPSLVAYQRK